MTAFFDTYKRRRVLVTGHTGFKGSWLCSFLKNIGCEVAGYSLEPPSHPAHFKLLGLDIQDNRGDVRDYSGLKKVFLNFKPEIVFHLAAQPIVRLSYEKPVETFETNVMGTVNLLEVCRQSLGVRAVVIVTSDKCYENNEWVWGYRENDKMGGHDPYSASKGCAEIATSSYRRSFLQPGNEHTNKKMLVASVRSGNVIGGGDWAQDRIIPDIMRANVKNKVVQIRSPEAVRPWQHVLEPLVGYLMIGARLINREDKFADAWNFGPSPDDCCSVGELTKKVEKQWSNLKFEYGNRKGPHEAAFLLLDSLKARRLLGWKPIWNLDQAIYRTINWYKKYYEQNYVATNDDIRDFIGRMEEL